MDSERYTELLCRRGEGFYHYEIAILPDLSPIATESDASDPVDFETQLVYRPVIVEENDRGVPYAYFYDPDASTDDLLENGGKVYVPIEHVRLSRSPNAEPAHRHRSSYP